MLDVFSPASVGLTNTCLGAPLKAALNTFALTFKSRAHLCSNYPGLQLKRADGAFPSNRDEWQRGVFAKAGEEVHALVYISNAAANNPVTPESIARNIKLTARVDSNTEPDHRVTVTFGGDNTNRVTESLPIKIGPDEYLEIVPYSSVAYDWHFKEIQRGLNLANGNVITIEDLYPGFRTDLFISFKIKIKQKKR
jgi:hypothetical protein